MRHRSPAELGRSSDASLFIGSMRQGPSETAMPFILLSPAFLPGAAMPAEYTCDGADISPPLAWSGTPEGTRSLVLIVEDPDAPGGTFRHWAAFDIAPGARGLATGYGASRPADGFREGRNDFGQSDYRGPCPPPGPAHHYHFRLYAISRPSLDLTPVATALDVVQAAQPYIIRKTELVGTYRR
jgi:Raf kinase inhibitor-like YbhB/YbcL family protein